MEQDRQEEEEYDEDQERREQREYDDYGELRRGSEDASMVDMDRMVAGDSGNDDSAPPNAGDNENLTPNEGQFRHSTPQLRQPVPSDSINRSRRGALTIVDYGHDEVAMSPEPECSHYLHSQYLSPCLCQLRQHRAAAATTATSATLRLSFSKSEGLIMVGRRRFDCFGYNLIGLFAQVTEESWL